MEAEPEIKIIQMGDSKPRPRQLSSELEGVLEYLLHQHPERPDTKPREEPRPGAPRRISDWEQRRYLSLQMLQNYYSKYLV